jgi:hypothetical protein
MKNTFLVSLLFAAAVAASPAVAFAQDKDGATIPRDASATRLRFDIAGTLVGGAASSRNVSAIVAAPGLTLDLGTQLGDRAAIYVRAEVASDLVTSQGAIYAIGEWTPTRWFSLGSGLGYDAISTVAMAGDASICSLPPCISISNNWSGISVPLIVGFNLGSGEPGRARRSMFRIGLEGAAGYAASTQTFGIHGVLAFGGAWM